MTNSECNPTDIILLARLIKHYDAEDRLNMSFDIHLTKKVAYEAVPVSEFTEHKPFKDTLWHAGRIRHFMDQVLAGKELDPVLIDNECSGGNMLPWPTLDDGHHRVLALWYLGADSVRVSYGGRIDVLKYLTGASDELPMEG